MLLLERSDALWLVPADRGSAHPRPPRLTVGTIHRAERYYRMSIRYSFPLILLFAACGASQSATTPSPGDMATTFSGPAPTYTELFARYFAPGTPGHCATAGCHADPGHNFWLCGTTKDSCYAGMVGEGLIDTSAPAMSLVADPSRSPLTWINPTGGNMPFDAPGAFPEGRDAIFAWIAAGAQNN